MSFDTLRTALAASLLALGLSGCSRQQGHAFLRDLCLQIPNCYYSDEDGMTRRQPLL